MFHRPTPSHRWVLRLVHGPRTCVVSRVNVLLRICTRETNLMVWTTPLLWACAAAVAILDIETAGETHVHVRVSFYDV